MGEASAWEEQAVKKWIEDDEGNKKYFEQFKLIWDGSKQLASTSKADENMAWDRFRQRIHTGEEEKPAPAKRFSWAQLAAAAILIFSIGLVTYILVWRPNEGKQMELLAEQTPLTDTLPDGSIVTVNKRSFIFYSDRPKFRRREVRLKGEAFFNVVPDKKKPFVVHANNVDVTVVGTSFHVKAASGLTEVIVESGIVQVTVKGQTIELRPGERTIITDADSTPVKQEVTDKLYNYYRTRQFVCDNTPLWKLVDVLNEAYSANITIGDEELRTLPIDVTFNNESLDQVLNVISLTFNIKVEKSGEQIFLRRNQ